MFTVGSVCCYVGHDPNISISDVLLSQFPVPQTYTRCVCVCVRVCVTATPVFVYLIGCARSPTMATIHRADKR